MGYELFEKYSREKEPTKYYKSYAWKTAIGLQKVDGLEPSKYLIETANKNINGDITFEDAHKLISSYYKENKEQSERVEEADKVSVRIAQIVSEKSFVFSPIEFITIHKRLFEGIYSHAGKIREFNIAKEEWILDNDTVTYGNAINLRETLEYDFSVEKNFSYKGLSVDDMISHISRFIANVWQIHVFEEGNTRTTAVFLIKYLSTLGFSVTNDIFAENSWYFRNALVRANYNNYAKGIFDTTEYLELFLRNLLLEEENILSNRELHVRFKEEKESKQEIEERKNLILGILKQSPQMTLEEVALKIGKSPRTVKTAVKTLQKEGRLARLGGKKSGIWEVK